MNVLEKIIRKIEAQGLNPDHALTVAVQFLRAGRSNTDNFCADILAWEAEHGYATWTRLYCWAAQQTLEVELAAAIIRSTRVDMPATQGANQ